MQYVTTETGRKWFHVVWHTHRRRRVFKIPAAARFCERELAKSLRRRGWIVDGLAFGSDKVQVLVRTTARPDRGSVVRQLLEAATVAVRRALRGAALPHRLWDDRSAWCAVITNAAGAAAVRRHLQAHAHAAGPDDRLELDASAAPAISRRAANAPP